MAPWYLAPDALAVLAGMSAKPEVEWNRRTYVLTSDDWGEFRGAEIERLNAIFKARFDALGEDWQAQRVLFRDGDPEDVLGALFGDPNGNAQFKTHRDSSPEWEAIRVNVAAALRAEAA